MKSTTFRFKKFEMNNSASGLKIGTDGVLLGAWADVGGGNHVWDVGCGTGLIALMLAQRYDCHFSAIEIERDAADEAEGNIARSPWKERIKLIHGNISEVAASLPAPDSIVSNPPYYASGKSIEAGNQKRDTARRDSSLCFASLIALASLYLRPEGNLFLISPFDRKADIEWEATLRGLHVRKCTPVITKDSAKPSRILWHISRVSGPTVTDRLLVRDAAGNYTDEFKTLTKDYYLNF